MCLKYSCDKVHFCYDCVHKLYEMNKFKDVEVYCSKCKILRKHWFIPIKE